MAGPSRTNSGLVKVAYAHNEAEAEFLQGLLREADVGSARPSRAGLQRAGVPGRRPPARARRRL